LKAFEASNLVGTNGDSLMWGVEMEIHPLFGSLMWGVEIKQSNKAVRLIWWGPMEILSYKFCDKIKWSVWLMEVLGLNVRRIGSCS
jgi:hypothetical protein